MGLDRAQVESAAKAIVDGGFDGEIAGDADGDGEDEADEEGVGFVLEADAIGNEDVRALEGERVQAEQGRVGEVEGVRRVADKKRPAWDAGEHGFEEDGGLDEEETADSPFETLERGRR